MNDNPYTGLINIMRNEGSKYNPPSICIGEVISPKPLTVKTEDLLLDSEDLIVNEVLLEGYKRTTSINMNATFSGTSGSLTGEGDVTFESSLQGGDLVVLVPAKQQYIILCKVVKLL